MQNPIRMDPKEIGIFRYHLWFEPEAQLQSKSLESGRKISESSRQLFFGRDPVAQVSRGLHSAFSKPAVIHHKGIHPKTGRLFGNRQDSILVKIKIGGLPVVDQDGTILFEIPDQVKPVKIVQDSGHPLCPQGRIKQNRLRRIKDVSCFQFPFKCIRMDSHCHSVIAKRVHIQLRQIAAGIDQMHAVKASLVIQKAHKGLSAVSRRSPARFRNGSPVSGFPPYRHMFSGPGAAKGQRLSFSFRQRKAGRKSAIQVDRRLSSVSHCRASYHHICILKNRIEKLQGKS